jgi:SpoU rRNA methylase family enzyme
VKHDLQDAIKVLRPELAAALADHNGRVSLDHIKEPP